MNWQPIETAPKDGREILVFALGQICIVAWRPVWHPDNKKWVARLPVTVEGEQTSARDFGPDFGADGLPHPFGRKEGPTHWMPLPPPPKDIQGDEKP